MEFLDQELMMNMRQQAERFATTIIDDEVPEGGFQKTSFPNINSF